MFSRFISTVTAIVIGCNIAFADENTQAMILEPSKEASHHYSFDVADMLKPGKAGYFALSPAHKVIGPVYSKENASEYIKEIFGLLIQAADSIASEYYKVGYDDNVTYWTFLVTALAIPHHESKLMHARLADRDLKRLPMCSSDYNELRAINSSKVLSVLQMIYREPTDPILPNCSVINKEPSVQQVLISTVNKEDVGFMQLNGRAFREALMPDVYLNVNNSARFGTYHYYDKFREIRSNFAKYSCMKGLNPYSDHELTKASMQFQLVQGTWGSYNIGNTLSASVCRFSNKAARNNEYDQDFKKHLEALVILNTSIYHKYLPENSVERRALDEIIYNFRSIFTKDSEVERNENVQAVLETDYISKYSGGSSKTVFTPNYYINTPTLILRHAPSFDPQWACGKAHVSSLKVAKKAPNLHVEKVWDFLNPTTKKHEKWAQVRVSKYADNIEMTSEENYCYIYGRDAFFVDANLISKVQNKGLTNTDLVGTVTQRPRNPNILEFYSWDSSIIGQVKPLSKLSIVEMALQEIKVRDRISGDLKSRNIKWYKILIPDGSGRFGWVSEQTFDIVTEK